jgi:PAS domain S-box-containing protein
MVLSSRRSEISRPVDAADLAAAFEHASAGMAITERGAVILHANSALGEMLGYAPEALVGKSVIDLTHPEDLPASLANNQRLSRGEISHFSVEKRYVHATGRPVWERVHVSVLAHTARRHHLVHVVDITHERSSAVLLQEAQQRFDEMTESIEQDFWLMSLDPAGLLYSSPAAERIWGFDPMVNRTTPELIMQHIHPDDVGIFITLFGGALERAREEEYRIVRPDGALRWLRTRLAPLRNAAGRIERLAGMTEDITARKHAELEVERHRAFERLVMEVTETFVNLPAERLGEGFERALGQLAALFDADRSSIFLLHQDTDQFEARYTWRRPGLDEGDIPFTVFPLAPDHPLRAAMIRDGMLYVENASALPDEMAATRERLLANGVGGFIDVPLLRGDRMIGFYACGTIGRPTVFRHEVADRMKIVAEVFTSAIERARAEAAVRSHHEALAHALRVGTMGQLAAGIAHELNQPLASILNYANAFDNLLASGHADVSHLRDGVRRLVEQAVRASDVIGTLRTLVRKVKGTRTWQDSNELVRTALRFIEPEASQAGARITVEPATNLPAVQVDPIQIEQVVLNLVRNAIDAVRALPDGAKRDIRVVTRARSADMVEVSISDTGPGIDPSRAGSVFDQFYTTKPDGLGLGLSISRSIIVAHGGELWMDAEPGPGATFRFTLSAASSPT